MSTSWYLRMIWRLGRGAPARTLAFCASLALGVAAVTAVAALGHTLEHGLRSHARELLGGDLALESRRPLPELTPLLPPELRAHARVQLAILPTMVRTEDAKVASPSSRQSTNATATIRSQAPSSPVLVDLCARCSTTDTCWLRPRCGRSSG